MDLFDDERPEINLDKYDQNEFNNLEYDSNGFNKQGIHQNGTIFDEHGYDQFGFNFNGLNQNGTYYDENDMDYLGYDRLYIQRFLTALRRNLNINDLLNVFCIIKFNLGLEQYLEKNNTNFKKIIRLKKVDFNNKLHKKYIKTFKHIYNFDLI